MLNTLTRPLRRAPAPFRMALRLWYGLHQLIRESLKFLTVGSVGFAVDVLVFNALLYAGGDGPLNHKPLTAKTISVVAATLVTYTGNRVWTFRHRARTGFAREYVLFFLLNGVGLGIALCCLGISRYALGLSGPLADNVAANVIGLGLGTLFRFWSYRRWVFPDPAVRRGSVPLAL
ncbi:MAG TPA: GtrA family protein [Jiangellaceae bacterium]|nr:GtrA family protein [Jiangellaceae bacterium]